MTSPVHKHAARGKKAQSAGAVGEALDVSWLAPAYNSLHLEISSLFTRYVTHLCMAGTCLLYFDSEYM